MIRKYKLILVDGRVIDFENEGDVMEVLTHLFEKKVYGLSLKVFVNTNHIVTVEVEDEE